MFDPRLLVEFVREFHLELTRLRAAAAEASSSTEKRLADLQEKIERMVQAIADGTDSASLRDALMRLESEKAIATEALINAKCDHPIRPVARPEILFRRKVAALQESLVSDEKTATEAGLILRSLIDRVTIHPAPGRGNLSVEIQAEPSAVFLLAGGGADGPQNWMIKVVAEEGLEPPTRGL